MKNEKSSCNLSSFSNFKKIKKWMYSKINHFFIFQNCKKSNQPKTHILVSFAKMYQDHMSRRCNTNLGNWTPAAVSLSCPRSLVVSVLGYSFIVCRFKPWSGRFASFCLYFQFFLFFSFLFFGKVRVFF